jgi:hypothetical protein
MDFSAETKDSTQESDEPRYSAKSLFIRGTAGKFDKLLKLLKKEETEQEGNETDSWQEILKRLKAYLHCFLEQWCLSLQRLEMRSRKSSG